MTHNLLLITAPGDPKAWLGTSPHINTWIHKKGDGDGGSGWQHRRGAQERRKCELTEQAGVGLVGSALSHHQVQVEAAVEAGCGETDGQTPGGTIP